MNMDGYSNWQENCFEHNSMGESPMGVQVPRHPRQFFMSNLFVVTDISKGVTILKLIDIILVL